VADDANQALPRLALFLAQGLAEVRQNEQLVRPPALTEAAAPDLPAPDAAGERRGDHAWCLAAQALGQVQIGRASSEQTFRRLAQEARARAVHELQLVILVEREDRDIDLGHHLSQEGCGLERVEALVPQRFDEGVDFDHDFAEGIAASGAAGADRAQSRGRR
jgi:hypothetical protein